MLIILGPFPLRKSKLLGLQQNRQSAAICSGKPEWSPPQYIGRSYIAHLSQKRKLVDPAAPIMKTNKISHTVFCLFLHRYCHTYPPWDIPFDVDLMKRSWARICKPFKEARNRFPAWRTGMTTQFVVPPARARIFKHSMGARNRFKFKFQSPYF